MALHTLGKRTPLPTILRGQGELCDWWSLKFELQHFLDYTAPLCSTSAIHVITQSGKQTSNNTHMCVLGGSEPLCEDVGWLPV